MKAYIKAISYYLPKDELSNEDLAGLFPEWNVKKISSKVGISIRHFARKDETATDMAVSAAENLFKEYAIQREEIDFVLLCTQSPDYILPTSACLIQNRLNIPTQCGALDFNMGCSGYVYGLSLAKGLIMSGVAKNILLLTAETYTKFIHPKDKSNRSIFGDAATASLVSTDGFAEIKEFSLGTDGRGAENLIVKTRGAKHPEFLNDYAEDYSGAPLCSDCLYMNGSEIFNFTTDAVPFLFEDILLKNNLTKEKLDLTIFHQANQYMLSFLRDMIGIEEDRFYIYMEKVGNTVSNSIPIALYHAKKDDKLKNNVLLAGFGVGYSWGGVILEIR